MRDLLYLMFDIDVMESLELGEGGVFELIPWMPLKFSSIPWMPLNGIEGIFLCLWHVGSMTIKGLAKILMALRELAHQLITLFHIYLLQTLSVHYTTIEHMDNLTRLKDLAFQLLNKANQNLHLYLIFSRYRKWKL